MIRYLLPFLVMIPLEMKGQVTISGKVRDQQNGEFLIGVNIIDLVSNTGTTTNAFGFFSLSLKPADSAQICISFVGYQSQVVRLKPPKNQTFDIFLVPGLSINEVVVQGRKDNLHETRSISRMEIGNRQLQLIPSLLGEKDIMRAFQLMPGVQSGKEGSSGMFVRGGSPDQNLYLLDDIPLYNVNHLGGFVSVFNPDIISSVQLYKGGFPARYGGRLSALLDVRLKDGNNQKPAGSCTIGIVASKLTLEGPLKTGRSSYIFSVRRTLLDLFTRTYGILNGGKTMSGYTLLDGNAKMNFTLSDRDRLFFSAYAGQDNVFTVQNDYSPSIQYPYDIQGKTRVSWGNQCASSRWNHIYSSRLFSNTIIGVNRFGHQNSMVSKLSDKVTEEVVGDYNRELKSGIVDFLAKTDFDYAPTNGHQIRFGGGATFHTYDPSVLAFSQNGGGLPIVNTLLRSPRIRALESEAYLEDEFHAGMFSFNLGVHLADFFVDKINYPTMQPRLRASYQLSKTMSVKGAYTRMVQYIHLLSNSDAGLPTDLWVPSTANIPPQKSDLFVLGWTTSFGTEPWLELTIEGYYKWMRNLIEFGDGESYFSTGSDWQNKVVRDGKGQAYGLEFLLQKKEGRATGWIGYTWSKNFRQFALLNRGESYPYRYDRRNVLTVVLNYQFNEKWSVSGNWVYATGEAVTMAFDKYSITAFDTEPNWEAADPFTDIAFIYNDRNNYRMPAYHRLDLGVHYVETNGRKSRTWSFEIYNVYNRKNPYYLYFNNDAQGQLKLWSFSLFPIIPSISFKTEW